MTKEKFLENIDPWSSHRPLLWQALEATKESVYPILEMGCGFGSTPYLREYALYSLRKLRSIDNNKEWADRFNAEYTKDWDYMQWFYKQMYSTVLIDHAPGEHRKVALDLFASHQIHSEIIVIHDSEEKGWNASDYQVRPIFKRFRYVKDDVPKEKGAPWSTALSHTIDVSKFVL